MVKVVSYDGATVELHHATAQEWFGEPDEEEQREPDEEVLESFAFRVKPIEGGRVISRRPL